VLDGKCDPYLENCACDDCKIIHTCEQCDANPFDYLVGVQQYAHEAAAHPECWMPWNYREALAQLDLSDDLA